MKLFKKKEVEVEVDTRTELEKNFEEKGQRIGKKTGAIVQKSVNKFSHVKEKLEQDGTMDKLRNIGDKVDDSIDKVVDSVTKKSKAISRKVSTKKESKTKDDEELFYK